MAGRKYEPSELSEKKLALVIGHRERGCTIHETARLTGCYPWQVAYHTRFIKACVTVEERAEIRERAAQLGLTEGELLADVYNTYIAAYSKRNRLRKVS